MQSTLLDPFVEGGPVKQAWADLVHENPRSSSGSKTLVRALAFLVLIVISSGSLPSRIGGVPHVADADLADAAHGPARARWREELLRLAAIDGRFRRSTRSPDGLSRTLR